MGSLEDRAKELAPSQMARLQQEREAQKTRERQLQASQRQEEERARSAQALAREFVALARKYGVSPLRLYRDAHQDGSKWQGNGYICEAWTIRSENPRAPGHNPGLAVNAKGEVFGYVLRADIMVLSSTAYGTLYLKDIEQAAAWIVAGEPISAQSDAPPKYMGSVDRNAPNWGW